MRLTDAPDVLRAAGVPVKVLDGYNTRGADLPDVFGVVEHCTVTPGGRNPLAVAHLLRDGHSKLRGPLSQLGHDDTGTWWCIASGKCNHNGYGLWGNNSVGVEKMHPNTGAWPYHGLDSWVRGSAALAAHYRVPVLNVRGHRETDAKRKSDPANLDLNAFRRAVARINQEYQEDDMLPEDREMLKRVEGKLDRLIDGVPAYGVPPMHETQLQVAGIVSGPIQYMRHTADREMRRNIRRVGQKMGLVVRDTTDPKRDIHHGELVDPEDEGSA